MADSLHQSKEFESKLRSACMRVTTLLGQGHAQPAREVLTQFPDLAAEEESALEIIYTEFQALDQSGQRPPLDQWLNHYPQHKTRLERLIKLHDLMDEGDSPTDSQADSASELGSIGNYLLMDEIGRGAMGIVYRARQQGLSRQVAVKVLRTSDQSDTHRSRFLQEAEAIAALQHPHIVQIYEIGVDRQRDYLSMELIEGGSLESWMQGPERSNHEIALLVKYLADAIGFAHMHGIIHRDLKPANVLLTSAGLPKVVDFGLAKRLDQAARVQTQTGTVLGTPSYMSPEQASGGSRKVGPPSDLFSLGVIIYQLLTRQLPFNGLSTVDTLKQIVEREPIAPSKVQRTVSRDLETICLKCLAKEPKQRYATAQHLVDDLNRFLDHRPILARRAGLWEKTSRTIARHREVSILAAALVASLGVGLFLVLSQRERLHAAQRQADAEQRRANQAEEAFEDSLKRARELLGRTTDIGVKLENEPGFDQTRRKAFEDAANYYEEFLEEHDSDPSIRIEAAQAAMRSASLHADLGMWTEAEGRLKRANEWLTELANDRAAQWLRSECLLQLANCQRRLERWSESEATFTEMIGMLKEMLPRNPKHVDLRLRIANGQANLCAILRSKGRWDESLPVYLDALDHCLIAARIAADLPEPTEHEEAQSIAERVQQRVDQAAELRRWLSSEVPEGKRKIPHNPMAELALSMDDIAVSLRAKGQPVAAEHALRESLALRQMILENTTNNRFMEHYTARSMTNLAAYLISTGRVDEAMELTEKAEKLFSSLVKDFPDRVNYHSEWARSHVQLSRGLRAQNKIAESAVAAEKAVVINEQLIAQHPDNQSLKGELVYSLIQLANSHIQLGKFDQSSQEYRRAIEVRPDMPDPYNSLAWQISIKTSSSEQEYGQAVDYAKKAVELSPTNANYWNTLTLALYRTGAISEGLTAAARSQELAGGGDVSDWYFQAMLLAKLGKLSDAQSWFQRAEVRRQAEANDSNELARFAKEAADALAAAPQ